MTTNKFDLRLLRDGLIITSVFIIKPMTTDRLIESYPGNPVQVFTELKAKSVTSLAGGKYLFDLGQNFAGIVRLIVKGEKGDTVTIRYGEVLFPEGKLKRIILKIQTSSKIAKSNKNTLP